MLSGSCFEKTPAKTLCVCVCLSLSACVGGHSQVKEKDRTLIIFRAG